jgi:hypothetical protein
VRGLIFLRHRPNDIVANEAARTWSAVRDRLGADPDADLADLIDSAAVPETRWTLVHSGVTGELFFFKGYAAEGSSFHYGHLVTKATSYACQEIPLPPDDDRFHNRFHFALDYRPDLATSLGDNNPGLPDPHGFSGSLVWNTRFVELGCNIDTWTPDDAVVTGLVLGLANVCRMPGGNTRRVCTQHILAGSSSVRAF